MKLSRFMAPLLAATLMSATIATPARADSRDSGTSLFSGDNTFLKWMIFLALGGLGGAASSKASGNSTDAAKTLDGQAKDAGAGESDGQTPGQ